MNPLADHVKLIQQLASGHRPFGWTDESVAAYLMALGDLPIDAFRRVVVSSLQTGEKMPAPSELRRACLDLLNPNRPPSVEEAWQEVETQLSSVGRDRKPVWSHPLVGVAQKRTGQWFRLCNSENLKDERWTFKNAYKDLVQQAEREALTSRGLSDTAALTGEPDPTMYELGTGEETDDEEKF